MKKLLVVDDENIIREGLKTMIQGSVPGIDEILEAKNGDEALEIITREQIDILMADLHMPGMSGMELIRQVRARDKRIAIIVLSGYSEFAYAQGAIQYKVLHYLLKPVKRAELFDILQTAVAELDAADRFQQKLQENVNQRIASMIRSGAKIAAVCQTLHTELGIDLQGMQCAIALGRHSCKGEALEQLKSDMREAHEKLQRECGEACPQVHAMDMDENLICMLLFSRDLHENEEIPTKLGRLLCSTCRDSDHTTWGISEIQDAYSQDNKQYRQARNCINERVLYGDGRVYTYKTVKKRDNRLVLSYMDYFQICSYVDDNQYEDLRIWLHEHFDTLVAEKRISSRAYLDNLKNILLEVLTHYNYGESLADEAAKVEALADQCRDYNDTVNRFLSIVTNAVKSTKKSTTDVKSQSIMVAQEYIKQNYNRQLTLDDIAAQVAKNPAYFSASFKRETGMHLMDYINEVRIEMAMKKLKDPKTKIYEVAYDTGFLSDKYFSKVFKKITGSTPKEYRNQQS
ncbi:MAG: response regulator [Eubacteriales bacterium]|nr:response regulator [Eubacteriales bacterium]